MSETGGSEGARAAKSGSGQTNPLQELESSAVEFGRTAWSKLKDVGENVGSRFGGMVDTARLNSEKAQKQREISEAYQQLGEMAYRQGGLTGDMAKVSDKIHQLYQELQNIEIQRNATDSR